MKLLMLVLLILGSYLLYKAIYLMELDEKIKKMNDEEKINKDL